MTIARILLIATAFGLFGTTVARADMHHHHHHPIIIIHHHHHHHK